MFGFLTALSPFSYQSNQEDGQVERPHDDYSLLIGWILVRLHLNHAYLCSGGWWLFIFKGWLRHVDITSVTSTKKRENRGKQTVNSVKT